KPNKSNYRLAKAYQLISLLATLKKVLELILIKRLLYLNKTHSLLLKYYFSA
ncbi:hypothetical protein EV356DRAFT_458166, partial [Viridothelium virens]